MSFMLLKICSCGNWYIEQDLGDGYYLFSDPHEILYSKDGRNFEFVILPHVVSYAYDSCYIVAKNHKEQLMCDSTKYWIVNKKDTISIKRNHKVFLHGNSYISYPLKGSVEGPFDSIMYEKYVDSLKINLKFQNIANN